MGWMNANRDEIKKKCPSEVHTDIFKTAGELWKSVPDKSKWEEKAEEVRKQYEIEYQKWSEEGGAEALKAQQQAQLQAQRYEYEEMTGQKRKKIRLEGQPKRALSSYMIWLNENRDEIRKNNPNL